MDCALTGQGNSAFTSVFWEKWTEYQDQLYRCCLKLMNSNPTDAEDALSQAMIKAWEKVQKFAVKIDNLKAWLFKLTSNLCIDIIRKRSRGAVGVESIEWVGDTEEIGIGSTIATPEICLEREEKSTEIQQAIANLPETLRETFILHFYQELTHTEIAQRQGISYDNVCRRIHRAKKQLKEKLSGYFQAAQEDVISSPVEHLHTGGKKAESSLAKPLPQARQMPEEKEESSQLDSHELSPQEPDENPGVSASPRPRVPASIFRQVVGYWQRVLVGLFVSCNCAQQIDTAIQNYYCKFNFIKHSRLVYQRFPCLEFRLISSSVEYLVASQLY